MGDKSAGNLLDTVYFSEEIPPPINETGTITIEKKVYGLDLSTARDNLTQSFISYNKDGQVTQVTYEPSDWKVKHDDEGNEYISAMYVLDELPLPSTYTIVENEQAAQIENYSMATNEAEITQTATLTENNKIARIAFTNTYTHITDEEDFDYIIAEKRFSGITENQIPENFKITLSKDGINYELTRNSQSFLSSETLQDGSIVWRWKVQGADAGTYSVTESGADVEDYKTTVTGVGDAVTVGAKTLTVNVLSSEETLGSATQTVKTQNGTDTLWAAVMKDGEVAVVSKSPLSAGTRAAVAAQIANIGEAYSGRVRFFSIDEQLADGSFVVNGASITYDAQNGTISINGGIWSANASLSVAVEEEQGAEITVTNTYEETKVDLTVTKTVAGKFGDKTKSFGFSYTYLDEKGNEVTGEFSLKNGESFTINRIPDNTVITISENNAAGYDISASYGVEALTVEGNGITFTVNKENGTVEVTNTKDKTPDTGIYIDSLPYIIAMYIIAACIVAAVLHKCKKRKE